jgi:hypothetical protein
MVTRALVGVLVVLAVACAAPSHPVPSLVAGSSSLSLPEDWHTVDLPAQPSMSPNPYDVGPTLIAGSFFSPDETLLATPQLKLTGTAPFGLMKVNGFTPDVEATLSIATLRDGVFNVDKYRTDHPTTSKVIEQTPIEATGMYGEHLIFSALVPSASKSSAPTSVTMDQTVYLAPTADRAFVLFIACTSDCYQRYQPTIEQVVSGWDPTTL